MAKKSIWPKVPAAFVDKNLTGHKILGLVTAAILYLISLSGTATVFYIDIERWETAKLAEVQHFSPQAVATAIGDMRQHATRGAFSINVTTPTPDYPRLSLTAGDEHARVYDADGRYSGPGDHPAMTGLTELHYYLHLPTTFGMIVVGLGGLAMLALIVGGLLAHPRIFKDAFVWRLNSTPRINRGDLHNRIGVWASPFHIVIALTGALIGLSQIFVLVSALAFNNGDTGKAFSALYPDISSKTHAGQMSDAAIVKALTTLTAGHPEIHPNYIMVSNLGSDHESLNVSAEIADRLVYGDNWEFDGKGNPVGRLHLADGAAGKQVFASLYRLHFGNFGGLWVRCAYVLLGAGLCLICTTGIDIWLLKSAQKGRPLPRLHKVWTGFAWAALSAMAIATLLTLSAGVTFVPVFWGVLVVLSFGGLLLPTHAVVSRISRYIFAASLLALLAGHVLKFGAASFGVSALGVNVTLTVLAVAVLVFNRKKAGA